jgi:hypothetical protein
MAKIYDRWHKTFPKPGDQPCAEHGKAPTGEHGKGGRWIVRWTDGGRPQKAVFSRKPDAEWRLAHLDGAFCLVPKCGTSAVTEPPVLLCADHRDLLLQQLGRKKPTVHDPVCYFIRNGGRIKIGWTTNLKARLSSLALPQDAVELTIPGGPSEEDWLHEKFSRARVGRTEWFESVPELEDFIARRKATAA